MIKKLLLFFLLIGFSSSLFAQGGNPTLEQINKFKGTTTLVVLDGRDVAFDAMLTESVKKFWKITPYEIVNNERFDKEKANPAYSFLVLTQAVFTKDKIESTYNFLNLLLSHPTGNINDMPVMAYVPFCGSPFTSNQHIFKTGVLLKAIQYQVDEQIKNQKSVKISKQNKNIPKLNGKELLISKNDISPAFADSATLKKLYRNSIKIVGSDEFEKAVIGESSNTVILHKVMFNDNATSGRCYKMLIDVNDGTIYYYKMDKVSESKPGLFLKKDFRKIRWYPFHWL